MKEKKKEEKKMQTDGGVDPNWRYIAVMRPIEIWPFLTFP